MMTYPETIYAQGAAHLLGIKPRGIRQLVRDRHLFTIPLPEGGWVIPREILVEATDGWEPLFSLPGTLTLPVGGDFTEDEAAAWFYTKHDELGETPMEVILAGHHHRVNAIASTLTLRAEPWPCKSARSL